MKKRNKLWSYALAGALAVSNMTTVVAMPMTSIVAQAADEVVKVPMGAGWTSPAYADKKFQAASNNSGLSLELGLNVNGGVDTAAGLTDGSKVYFVAQIVVGDYTYEDVIDDGTYVASTTSVTGTVSKNTVNNWGALGDAVVSIQAYGSDKTNHNKIDRNIILGDPIELNAYKYLADTIEWDVTAAKTSILQSDEEGFDVTSIKAKRDNVAIAWADVNKDGAVEAVVVTDKEYSNYLSKISDYEDALKTANEKWLAYSALPEKTAESTAAEIAAKDKAEEDYNTAVDDAGGKLALCTVEAASKMKVTASGTTITVAADPTIGADGKVYPNAGKYHLLVAEKNAKLTATGYAGEIKEFAFTVVDNAVLELTSENAKKDEDHDDSALEKIGVGEEEQITVKLSGVSATPDELKNITWKSSDPKVVSVDANGKIKALKDSDEPTIITATYKADGIEIPQIYTVTKVAAPEVALKDSNNIEIETDKGDGSTKTVVGQTFAIFPFKDGDAWSGTVEWKVTKADGSATTTATVAGGNFKATAAGEYKVDAKFTILDGYTKTATGYIVVEDAKLAVTRNGVTLVNNGNLGTCGIDSTIELKATLGAEDVTSSSEIAWKSYNTKVATVENGLITTTGEGTTTVEAKYGDQTIQLSITVNANVYTIKLEKDNGETVKETNVFVGDKVKATAYLGKEVASDVKLVVDDELAANFDETTGLITTKMEGNIEVSLYTSDGKKKLTSTIIPVNAIVVNFVDKNGDALGTTLAMNGYEKKQIVARYGREEITGEWESSDTTKVSVVDGLVTVKTNTATTQGAEPIISFKYKGSTTNIKVVITAFDKFTVKTDSSEPAGEASLGVGKTVQLIVLNGKDDVTANEEITFKVEKGKEKYISVNENTGLVTGLSQGSGKVEVLKDGKSTSPESVIDISVAASNPTTDVTLDNYALTLPLGEEASLKATITPAGTTDDVVWASSDESVVTVKDGVIKGVKEGTAEITVTSGAKKATCKVTVKETEKQKAEKAEQQKAEAIEKAVNNAETAAAAATKDPSDANIKALEDAIDAARTAGASDDEIKALTDKYATALKGAKANAETAKTAAETKAASDVKAANDAKTAAETKAANDVKAAKDAQTAAEKKAAELQKTIDNQYKKATKVKATNGYVVNTFANGEATITSIPAAKTKATMTIASKVTVNGKKYKVTKIANKALYNNTKIKTLTVPASVTQIGTNAFGNMTKVTKITVKGKNVQVLSNAFKKINKKAKIVAANAYTRKQITANGGQPKAVKVTKK